MLLSHRVTIHPSLAGTFPLFDVKSRIPGDSLAPGKPGWSPYVSHNKIIPTAAPSIWERRIPCCIFMFLNLLGQLFGARRAYLACPHCVFGGEGECVQCWGRPNGGGGAKIWSYHCFFWWGSIMWGRSLTYSLGLSALPFTQQMFIKRHHSRHWEYRSE